MKKTAIAILSFFILTNVALAGPFCIKEPICIREPETGLYLIKINTKHYSVRPYIIDPGFDTSENVFNNNKFALVVNNDYDTYSWLTQSATNGKLELDLTNCNITSEIAIVATTKPESGGFNNFSYGWIEQYRGDVDAVITAIYLVEK